MRNMPDKQLIDAIICLDALCRDLAKSEHYARLNECRAVIWKYAVEQRKPVTVNYAVKEIKPLKMEIY